MPNRTATPERLAAVDALGPVAHLVAPNRIHSLGVEPWRQRYPDARVWLSPRFLERHPDQVHAGVLGDQPPSDWRGQLDQAVFGGSSFLDEVIMDDAGNKMFVCSDTDYCRERVEQGFTAENPEGQQGLTPEHNQAQHESKTQDDTKAEEMAL